MRWRPVVARIGIWAMLAFVVTVVVLLTLGLLPPLPAISAGGTAVVSIAGFRYYLTHRGHQ